jgi:hypothetical protein
MEFCVSNRSRPPLIIFGLSPPIRSVTSRLPFHFGPPRANTMFVSEGAESISAHRMRKLPRNLAAEETSPGQPLRKLSLPVANLAINLGPLLSPVQQGEMNELFIKRESSQA